MKIKDVFGRDNVPTDAKEFGPFISGTNIGIEHELEGVMDVRTVSGWRLEHDGSLRNSGIEYVFAGPQAGESAAESINNLAENFKKVKHTINERTSTHLHIDFNSNSVREVGRFILIYCILEDVLFQLCDDSRKDNPYCVSIRNSHVAMSCVSSMLQAGRISGDILSESYRYSALNMASLRTFGTLEVRMRETVIDPEELIFWINIFLAIKQYAVAWKKGSPGVIFKTISGEGVDRVMSDILSPVLWEEVVRRVPDAEALVYEGIRDLLGTVIRPTLTEQDVRNMQSRDDLLGEARERVDDDRPDAWAGTFAEMPANMAMPTQSPSAEELARIRGRLTDVFVHDEGSASGIRREVPVELRDFYRILLSDSTHTARNELLRQSAGFIRKLQTLETTVAIRRSAVRAYQYLTGETLSSSRRVSYGRMVEILGELASDDSIRGAYRQTGRAPSVLDLLTTQTLAHLSRS